jgi:hypothetical protein
VTEAHLRRAQEETEQATQALKQVQEVLVEQCRLAEQEKVSLQTKFEEEKAQIQQEKEQLLAEQLEVKEAVNRALSLCDRLRDKGRRPHRASSREARGSYPTTTTKNNRLRALRSARHSAGCERSKRCNCLKHS